MNKNISFLILLLSLVFLSSCQKDEEVFIPDAQNVKVDIFGIVVDQDDNAIIDAEVEFNGKIEFTDQYGIYKFQDVRITKRHNYLNIKKDGYFEGVRTFRSNKDGNIRLETQLLEKDFTQSFNAASGGRVLKDGVDINFPPNAIMVESNREPYNGIVQVAIQYLDPTDDQVIERMPGDFSALDSVGTYSVLTSYGMMFVELASPTGEKLQIASGQSAVLQARIPSSLVNDAPNEIPMWFFNYSTGLWEEEGSALKTGNRYVGSVTHFSCWNYDWPEPGILLSGRVIDQNGNPVTNVYISAHTVGGGGGHGSTDSEGRFNGLAPKDELLDFRIRFFDDCINISNDLNQIGPFSEDTDLGDIIVEIESETTLSVNASFVDCDGNKIEDGFIKILQPPGDAGLPSNYYFEIIDGKVEANILACSFDDYYLVATDRTNLKQTSEIDLVIGETNDLGEVVICDLDADLIFMECEELDFSITLVDTLGFTVNETSRGIKGIGENEDVWASIYFDYNDIVPNVVSEGTFPIEHEARIRITNQYFEDRSFYIETGEVTITQGASEIGDKVKGNFIMTLDNDLTAISYDFSGNFILTY